jgi:hypothetical protein
MTATGPGPEPVNCFPALDEAGQYERADDRSGGTAWDTARALAPGDIFLPGRRRDAIVSGASRPGASGFPPGWDTDTITGTVLAVARDPDRITWNDPAGWPGTAFPGQPCWRAEGTTNDITVTVALSADGEILGARHARRPGAVRSLGRPPAATEQPGKDARQEGNTVMTASDTTALAHGQAGDQGGHRCEQGGPDRLPAVISHLTAICRARQHRGVTADVQFSAPGRYVLTVCNGRKEATLAFARRKGRWDLDDVQLTKDGEPVDAARSIYEVIRLLSDHEIGTGTPSRTSGARLPRDSALETKKNTVLRV